jgi:hypothetical protein
MLNVQTLQDVYYLVVTCRDEFPKVVAVLDESQPETTEFARLRTTWQQYYFGAFARFDACLKDYIDGGGNQYAHYIPVSISHHNLHRLMEVLNREVGDSKLDSAPVPERINDLLEVYRRLTLLLDEKYQAGIS